jgi:predicted TIM-barrel fold metal-dependent hydrolase
MNDPVDRSHGGRRCCDGAIDCDVHVVVPSRDALLPYLDDYWRDVSTQRGLQTLDTVAYPRRVPLNVRPDWPLPDTAGAADQLERMRANLLDRHGIAVAICNCLYGVQVLQSEDMALAIARAVNDWIAREWLDREPRLRASIVLPMQNPEMAVEKGVALLFITHDLTLVQSFADRVVVMRQGRIVEQGSTEQIF